jgi:hypothetical protein
MWRRLGQARRPPRSLPNPLPPAHLALHAYGHQLVAAGAAQVAAQQARRGGAEGVPVYHLPRDGVAGLDLLCVCVCGGVFVCVCVRACACVWLCQAAPPRPVTLLCAPPPKTPRRPAPHPAVRPAADELGRAVAVQIKRQHARHAVLALDAPQPRRAVVRADRAVAQRVREARAAEVREAGDGVGLGDAEDDVVVAEHAYLVILAPDLRARRVDVLCGAALACRRGCRRFQGQLRGGCAAFRPLPPAWQAASVPRGHSRLALQPAGRPARGPPWPTSSSLRPSPSMSASAIADTASPVTLQNTSPPSQSKPCRGVEERLVAGGSGTVEVLRSPRGGCMRVGHMRAACAAGGDRDEGARPAAALRELACTAQLPPAMASGRV